MQHDHAPVTTPKHPSATIVSAIGIDPGPTTGICLMEFVGPYPYPLPECNITLIQANAANALRVLEAYLSHFYQDERIVRRVAGVEAFVTGQSAGTRGKNADLTRQYVMKFAELLQLFGYPVKIRKAGDVKPWASDKRLLRAGVPKLPDSMRHSGDGARHCLFAAVKDAHMKDPLA
jgi:hypothetical protein